MASNLPDYIAAAQPVPMGNRVPWYKSTAQTYASIMLWFVFWQAIPAGGGAPGGAMSTGLQLPLVALVVAALLCHFLFYLVPGMLGLKTGLPLYIVGTSTYGATGGFLMPGFLMGLLQFGWLGVNAFYAAQFLCAPWYGLNTPPTVAAPHMIVAAVWAILAAFMGLKGIKYVARVATFLPLIPFVVLVVLTVKALPGLPAYDAAGMATLVSRAAAIKHVDSNTALSAMGILAFVMTYVIGFFATAGAAGADFGMNNRNARDVSLGGLVGIAGSTLFAGGLSLLIIACSFGTGWLTDVSNLETTTVLAPAFGKQMAGVIFYLLALAAFPGSCFSAFIAANSFKTTLPKVNPFISVGIGTAVSIVLAATGKAGDVISVFQVIGASFGPICGAMAADYLLAGKKWAGPRAGFNPAGWISWAVGFVVGSWDLICGSVPQLAQFKGIMLVPPLAAFVVGFVLYVLLAKMGLESRTLDRPATIGPEA